MDRLLKQIDIQNIDACKMHGPVADPGFDIRGGVDFVNGGGGGVENS